MTQKHSPLQRIKRRLFHIAALLAWCSLFACEGNTTRVWMVRNSSEDAIKVTSKMHQNYQEGSDTLLIPPATFGTFGINDQRGGTANPGSPSDYIITLQISNASNDSITKDYREDSNWTIRSQHRKKVPSDYLHEFTFEIFEADFILTEK